MTECGKRVAEKCLTGSSLRRRRSAIRLTAGAIRRRLFGLADIQSLDLSGRAELEPEIGPEVTPLVGVRTSSQIEPVVFDKIDGSEALVTEGFLSNFPEAARLTVVIPRRVRLK
jgi:hypothetical protein